MQRVTKRGLTFLLALFILLSLALAAVMLPFFAYAFFGAFAGFLVYPLYRRTALLVGRRTAAVLLVLLVYAILFIPLGVLVWNVADDLANVVRLLQEHGTESVIFGILSEVLTAGQAAQVADALAASLSSVASGLAPQLVFFALNAILGFFIFGFICFYTLVEGHEAVHFLKDIIPLRRFRVDALLEQIKLSLKAVFFGVLIVAVIQATAGGLVWWVTGLPNPFFYGAVMFVLSIIPFTGPSFILVPVGIVKLAQGNAFLGVFLILSGVLFVGGIDNLLRPVLVARFGRINPAMVVLGLAGGLVAFGIVGLFVGPLVFALWVAVAKELREEIHLWKGETLKEKPWEHEHFEHGSKSEEIESTSRQGPVRSGPEKKGNADIPAGPSGAGVPDGRVRRTPPEEEETR